MYNFPCTCVFKQEIKTPYTRTEGVIVKEKMVLYSWMEEHGALVDMLRLFGERNFLNVAMHVCV
jgi:hypothetical protein